MTSRACPRRKDCGSGESWRSCAATWAASAELDRLPDAVFVIDTKKEHIAVTEANKLVMPIVAVVDTNCDPDVITYVIPGNDDAIRSGALMCRVMAEAVIEGRWVAEHRPKPPAPPATPSTSGSRRPPRGPRAPVGSDTPEPPPTTTPGAPDDAAGTAAAETTTAETPSPSGATAAAPSAAAPTPDAPSAAAPPATTPQAAAPPVETPPVEPPTPGAATDAADSAPPTDES